MIEDAPPTPEDEELPLGAYLGMLRRRRLLMVAVAVAVAVVAAGIVYTLPSVYESSSTILIEQQEIPQDLVRSTVTTYADTQLELIRQRVMASASLLELITKYKLYAEARRNTPVETVLGRMAQDIRMESVGAKVLDRRGGRAVQATIAFTVAYRNESPQLAQRVANELTTLFLNENLKRRTALTEETTEFLAGESKKLGDRVAELEQRLASFKEQHAGALPELSALNTQMADRAERDIQEIDRQLRAVDERRGYLKAEQARLRQAGALADPELRSAESAVDPAVQLRIMQNEYTRRTANYLPAHPDVIRLRKEIQVLQAQFGDGARINALAAELETQEQALAELNARFTSLHPQVREMTQRVNAARAALDVVLLTVPPQLAEAMDPAQVQVAAQLSALSIEATSLKDRRRELEAKLTLYEQRLTKTPQVEMEYKSLTRDYASALEEYHQLRAKQVEAELAQSLESGRKGERFTLIEPPQLPEVPVSPERKKLLVLGIILALGAGLGSGILPEMLNRSVRDSNDLRRLTAAPLLGAIPIIDTLADVRQRRRHRLVAALGATACAAGALAAVHFVVMPIDTLWFVVLRRFGIQLT